MTDKATHMEARLMGLSKRRSKDGDYFELKLSLHPKDMPSELYGVPLGTRIGVAMVQIADDETEKPVKEKTPFKDLPRTQQAAMLCKEVAFQKWLGSTGCTETEAKSIVYALCRIDSLSELNSNLKAGELWDGYYKQYIDESHLAERR